MKIDFDMLEKMVAAGASGAVVLAVWRDHEAKKQPKRTKEAARQQKKRANKGQQTPTSSNTEQHAPTSANIHEPPNRDRGRLFGLVPRLIGLGLASERARQMLGQWAKVTRDNIPAIETAIASAELKQPADPIGYIRAVLQDRSSINGKRDDTMDAFDRIIAGTSGEIAGDPPMRDITPRGG